MKGNLYIEIDVQTLIDMSGALKILDSRICDLEYRLQNAKDRMSRCPTCIDRNTPVSMPPEE